MQYRSAHPTAMWWNGIASDYNICLYQEIAETCQSLSHWLFFFSMILWYICALFGQISLLGAKPHIRLIRM